MMYLKLFNPIKLFRLLSLFVKTNFDFLKNEFLDRKFYNINYLVDHLFKFDEVVYEKYKKNSVAEHQVGRIINMRNLIEKNKNEITGDLLELGVFQGYSLIYFDKFLDKEKKLIGIDTFEGLPYTSTDVSEWVKGEFNNTSMNRVANNLKKFNCRNVSLLKGEFANENIKPELMKLSKHISIVHFDCDLNGSAYDGLELIKGYLEQKKTMFILFDDWGVHQNEIPDAFYKWVDENQSKMKFKLEKLYTTHNTRYYKLSF